MGKKSKRTNRNNGSNPAANIATNVALPTNDSTAAAVAPTSNTTETTTTATFYPSDGPSDMELLQTTSQSLQTKLDRLTELGLANDRANFVHEFVPLDLSEQDRQGYLQDLTTAPEADGQWNNLVAEIAAIRCGKGVDKIEGDQVTNAVFYFTHPLLPQCDREVSFVCVNGEWRAEG